MFGSRLECAVLGVSIFVCFTTILALPVEEDVYHDLHLPHSPPLHPTLSEVPHTAFSCADKTAGMHADPEAQCQAFHLCQNGQLSRSFLCPNGTLFHEEYAVCDQFYNVRCGIDRRID